MRPTRIRALKMKKLIVIASVLLMATSCVSYRGASVSTTNIGAPVVGTATAATLEVSPTKITYTYEPSNAEGRHLSLDVLKENAVYEALVRNGNADALVEVNYYVTAKKRFFGMGTKYTRIVVSGYPVKYKDFREPTEADLKNIETLSRSQMMSRSLVKEVSLGGHER